MNWWNLWICPQNGLIWKKDINNINIHDFIANHMNICNYIRLEKMEEAKKIFESEFKHNSILIDRIWIRKLDKSWDIIYEIKLD